ncbi:MAG: hypothetical protein ACE5J3_09445 [Methanosarcinales archaeon]
MRKKEICVDIDGLLTEEEGGTITGEMKGCCMKQSIEYFRKNYMYVTVD